MSICTMPNLVIPCDPGQVSDGYHTFDELYEHRCLLFAALLSCHNFGGWKSRKHDDGTFMEGWFVAGASLLTVAREKMITYHLPEKHWDLVDVEELERAPKWDGHTSEDVLDRLKGWLMHGRR